MDKEHVTETILCLSVIFLHKTCITHLKCSCSQQVAWSIVRKKNAEQNKQKPCAGTESRVTHFECDAVNIPDNVC